MSPIIPIKTNVQIVRARLEAKGFTGLYVPGECGCHLGDFNCCGCAEEDDAGWINGCEPGNVVFDPSGKTSDWIVMGIRQPITQEDFDRIAQP